MKRAERLLDAFFVVWIFAVFLSLPSAVLDVCEPEWLEVRSSVEQKKVSCVLASEEMKARDFFKAKEKPKRRELSSRGSRRAFIAEVTAYCSCSKCCGKSDGITASGKKARWGTVAGPSWLTFGTRLKIEGFDKIFVVEDRGGAIAGNRIDVWFPSHEEALRFGRRRLKVEVLR